MNISYNWLCEYLPDNLPHISPEQLSKILTSTGLEVESLDKYESVKGGLQDLVAGEVVSCEQHPNADKLKLTKVDVGTGELLQIVCGAPNVAAGQKVIVARVGVTIYPLRGEPVTLKTAKIRGVESQGMICAADEVGLGEDHAGIILLPQDTRPGMAVSEIFHLYEDYIFGIGLTPNHMDAMSHLGVARDVCAYLSHHEQKTYQVKKPSTDRFSIDNRSLPISVNIENKRDCQRYSGVSIKGITLKESPRWMQDRLKAIGVRPISNIVDITNFVLHETGQPLHAFDADKIKGQRIIVKNLPTGTKFVTLDKKEIKLSAEDLMICDEAGGICLAGVFGGLDSGVGSATRNIFLESAWFSPESVRKTSFRHDLRTDAATHFEKGMDISGTTDALKRAAQLIRELAGGEIASDLVDVYPDPKPKTVVTLSYAYLKKLSGKTYDADSAKNILDSLGFEIRKQDAQGLEVLVPFHKPDISLPADIVEEIMRIDGLDNIDIPASISISPSIETDREESAYREKIADYLVGLGFHEIFTNSITNSAYFSETELKGTVKMINNLSAELNIMRPSLLETGLESIAYNLNRKNNNLRFFEFGKSYHSSGVGQYEERNHLSLYVTGNLREDSWKGKAAASDFYYLKGLAGRILELFRVKDIATTPLQQTKLENGIVISLRGQQAAVTGMVKRKVLQQFDIRQPVYFADLNWDLLLAEIKSNNIEFRELPRQLPVHRDLALVVHRSLSYDSVEKALEKIRLDKLREVQLFDIFESEKLGSGKKSLAISFSFLDEEKTLTDKEVDGMMGRIMKTFEQELSAEIRK
ncbi:MAG TPA: phenylalanine--tRNA ligase subunit beta [Puia sp.]|nr:phenylalanine--tRNA ligase subunit beta [Puia sp.]